MLPTADRLRRQQDFATAIRAGRRAGRATLVVHLALGDRGGPPRAGFIISRAVGGAVTRNRVRRRLQHLVRDHLGDLPEGTLLAVRATPAAATASYRQLAEDLSSALGTAVRRAGGTR
jgi:ribonuclease P protein component